MPNDIKRPEIPMEHERRFFPSRENLPEDLDSYPKIYIFQGYLEDELKTRIRHEYDCSSGMSSYSMTRKSGKGVSRQEDEREITQDEFGVLVVRDGCFLEKTRYFVPWEGVVVEINIFSGRKLEGYVQIEVEFDSHEEAMAFDPPDWFGPEVTDDDQHGNYSLAKNGFPER